ncbi:MAG TPA: TIGR02996 domain-containing protein [Gemmataceae bacterium]|nr:TIGR02996 domain-containing protein [Gemmataceae bacterium]
MLSLRDALESALVENPDDLATHYAYADYLQEQGDPRGEFIQVQLALEDPQRSEAECRKLQARANELLQEHQREWVGVLADELLGTIDGEAEYWSERERPYAIRFARGWLDHIVRFTDNLRHSDLGRLMCHAPETRLLRSLVLERDEGTVEELVHSPFLGNLRILQLGSRIRQTEEFELLIDPLSQVDTLVAKLPRLEQLHLFGEVELTSRLFSLPNLTNLRVLQVSQLADHRFLSYLAANPALGNLTHLWLRSWASRQAVDLAGVRAILQSPHLRSLTHLQLHRSDLGDVGCTEIVTSGILKRLKVLDLRHGEITDAGARILADCPDLRRLELLDIERNALTQTGIDILRRVLGPALRGDNQQTLEELAQRQYLYDEDFA